MRPAHEFETDIGAMRARNREKGENCAISRANQAEKNTLVYSRLRRSFHIRHEQNNRKVNREDKSHYQGENRWGNERKQGARAAVKITTGLV